MTRRVLQWWVSAALVYIVCLLVIGLTLSHWGDCPDASHYRFFKDMIPLLLAVPAAWLSALFQKRASFLVAIRSLYESSLNSVQSAIQYTHLTTPSQADFAAVKKDLATSIDLMRASFRNLEDAKGIGLFPFESLKIIESSVGDLGFGSSYDPLRAVDARREIVKRWKRDLRPALLSELDRRTPTVFDSPYWKA